MQYNTIQYSTIQYNEIQYNAIQCNATQYSTVQYCIISIILTLYPSHMLFIYYLINLSELIACGIQRIAVVVPAPHTPSLSMARLQNQIQGPLR